jgi:hypothetical protein
MTEEEKQRIRKLSETFKKEAEMANAMGKKYNNRSGMQHFETQYASMELAYRECSLRVLQDFPEVFET